MRSTKKTLLLSVLSLIMCVVMLMGTTYAWFTDSVKSGNNIIKAGNLDIELEYSKTGADGTWKTVESATELFADVALWEPGATSVVYLKLTNKGTLALKYNLSVNSTGGDFTNVAGEAKNLKDALKFAQVAGPNLVTYATREAAVAATSSAALGLNDYAQSNHMAANEVSYITLVVTMPTTIDNEFNYKPGTTAPEIALTVDLFATQYTAESDSFDKYYDVTAEPIDVYTVEEFNEAIKQAPTGTTINIMTADLELTVAFDTEKTYTIKGEKIKKLTADIPNGTIHVYNEVGEVVGTNVDLQNSAHFYNKIAKLLATAGHFVVEVGSTVDEIKATPTEVKDLVIEIKGAAGTVTAPEDIPEKNVDIKVAGTVDTVVVPAADTKVAVKVSETGTVDTLNITDETEAKIVLQNFGTIEEMIPAQGKTQTFADSDSDSKKLVIYNADDIKAFAKDVNGGKNYSGWVVELANDIDLAGVNWTPIGRTNRFEGTFDGKDHTIKNLNSVGAYAYGNGLFGDITGGAVLKNFTIKNANVANTSNGSGNVYGIVCGYAYGTVTFENITVKNSKVSAFGKVGAILGMAADAGGTTTIKNCNVVDTEIIGAYNCATFAGLTQNAVVMSGNKQSGVTFTYSSRYGAECYTDVNDASAGVCGKYWMYENTYYFAAWADLYNELKETKINGGAVTVDSLVHGVTRKVTPVGGQTAEQALQSALSQAGAGDTVVLGEETVITAPTKVDKDLTLSGGKIAPATETAVPVSISGNGTTATLTDVTVTAGKASAAELADNTKLVIDGGSMERTVSGSTAFNQLIAVNDNGEISIGGGEYKHTSGGTNARLIKFDDAGGKANITDGNFAVGAASDSHASVVYLDSDVVGEVKIGGGDYTVDGGHGAVIQGGKEGTTVVIDGGNFKVGNVGVLVNSSVAKVIVNDCTYVSDMTGATGSPKYSYIFNVSGTAKVTVKGGSYTLDLTANTVRICSFDQAANVILEGGTFNVQPSKSATIADGFKEVDNGNGTWTVVAQ